MRRFLQSQAIVGILAVIALGLVARNILFPAIQKGRPAQKARAPRPQANQPQAAPPPASGAISATNMFAGAPMNLQEILQGWQAWTAVTRDPFYQAPTNAGAVSNAIVRAEDRLALSAIWSQNDSKPMAILGGRIVKEGDEAFGYTVKKIGRDSVEVEGTNGLETLRLGGAPKTAPARRSKLLEPSE